MRTGNTPSRWLGLIFLLVLLSFSEGTAWAILLEMPIDCQIGKTCFIQNYVDMAPGPDASDHTCGPLTYDKHKGTDFRVTFPEMMQGVKVLAAAPGVVRGARDGVMDALYSKRNAAAVQGRECGNGVVIQHPDGTQTQYCHMRRGSIQVKPGEQVTTGQVLGLVGLSGQTEFPHLHFEVRIDGNPYCPFTGRIMEGGCGEANRPLWTARALEAMPYVAGGSLGAGFVEVPVKDASVLFSMPNDQPVRPQSAGLFFWAAFWGIRQGDVIQMRLVPPKGPVWTVPDYTVPGNQAQYIRFFGRKLPPEETAWTAGEYRGLAVLLRGGKTIASIVQQITVSDKAGSAQVVSRLP